MKAVFTILAHRVQAGAAVRAGAPADAVCGVVPEVVVARGRNQPTGRVSAADGKPSNDRSAEFLRAVRTVRGFRSCSTVYAVLLGWSVVFGRRKRQQAMLDQAGDGSGSSALTLVQHPQALR